MKHLKIYLENLGFGDEVMEPDKEYHDKLASIIKGTHAKLRLNYRTCK